MPVYKLLNLNELFLSVAELFQDKRSIKRNKYLYLCGFLYKLELQHVAQHYNAATSLN